MNPLRKDIAVTEINQVSVRNIREGDFLPVTVTNVQPSPPPAPLPGVRRDFFRGHTQRVFSPTPSHPFFGGNYNILKERIFLGCPRKLGRDLDYCHSNNPVF